MATVYIKPGTGTGSGTLAAPYFFDQLVTAENAAGSGGTILFTDGTYNNPGTFDSANVTYESLNLHGAVMTGDGPTFGSGSADVTVKKFKITPSSTERIDLTGSGTVADQLHIETTNSFNIRCNTSGITLTNSLMKLSLTTGNSYGRQWGNFGTYKGNTLFITDLNGRSANAVSCHTSSLGSGVPKNSIFATDDSANNVITTADNTDANSTNCCFHQFGANNASDGTNNVFSDPLFVDATSDYRLRPSSPCINAGTTS